MQLFSCEMDAKIYIECKYHWNFSSQHEQYSSWISYISLYMIYICSANKTIFYFLSGLEIKKLTRRWIIDRDVLRNITKHKNEARHANSIAIFFSTWKISTCPLYSSCSGLKKTHHWTLDNGPYVLWTPYCIVRTRASIVACNARVLLHCDACVA